MTLLRLVVVPRHALTFEHLSTWPFFIKCSMEHPSTYEHQTYEQCIEMMSKNIPL